MSHLAPVDLARLPPVAARLLDPLPLAPLTLAAGRLLARLARRDAALFERLGGAASKSFLIDPTDLPFVFLLHPDPARPEIRTLRRHRGLAADTRIAAPLAVLLGLVQGTYDGDAVFFSRDLMIEGDVEAVLALRNAIDDAEFDLLAEAAGMLGPLRRPAEAVARDVLSIVHWFAQVLPPRSPDTRAP